MIAFRDFLVEQIQDSQIDTIKKNEHGDKSSCHDGIEASDKNKELAIQFIFGHNKLLELLQQRADALKNRNFDGARKFEDKMTEYKNENLQKLMRPQHALVIFQDDQTLHSYVSHVK